ncbi:YCII-related protein [Kribbella flavida DSM 17836]|uniref:YCII-related protein n=1 Tax=Kribbella flavida (strain DSM 17836 / JCM 10339 / NBRC 14399) TaxID=479435 RepID=D2Q229_KRIFD|nr:YciI family protein [Kribbella flavida]ADB33975.1 YCII-related protein [Kribbella flavida DSM 17836]
MAQYMFLLYDSEDWYDQVTTPEEWQRQMDLHNEFSAAVIAAGAQITGGAALERSSTASTVKQGDGEPLVTDGPFIETKEALGGFYLIDAKDLDQALALAKLCPSGNVEVRPVMDTSEDSGPPA